MINLDKIVLFDGECNLCDRTVQFIIKRDKKESFRFASIQSSIGQSLLNKLEVPNDINSFILIDENKSYIKSTAALRVCKELRGVWKLLYIFIFIPRPLRDMLYTLIAKNRYKWFGKKDNCILPTPEMKNRFL